MRHPRYHFQTMVGGKGPLSLQIRPVPSICSSLYGLHLSSNSRARGSMSSSFLLLFLLPSSSYFLLHFPFSTSSAFLFFLFLFRSVREYLPFQPSRGIETQWFQRIASSQLFTSLERICVSSKRSIRLILSGVSTL